MSSRRPLHREQFLYQVVTLRLANEEAEEEEEDNDITNADNIRQAHTVVTTRDAALPDNTNLPRTRLTFSIEAPVARNALSLAEDPRPKPLDRFEQFAT